MKKKSFRSVARMNLDQLSNANSAGTVDVYRNSILHFISVNFAFRCILADHSRLLEHRPGQEANWKNPSWVDYALTMPRGDKPCRQAFFVIPPQWLKQLIQQSGGYHQLGGKVHCFKCNAKVGAYHWKQSIKCPCSASFLPAFYFQSSRVDFLS